jgi:hypothetical protein
MVNLLVGIVIFGTFFAAALAVYTALVWTVGKILGDEE